ncbi:MAG TPA: hypothetical protein VJ742_13260 [Nitrososphaera sp.]|nr:hypothetical protein [Nitrososphaera sp.]
MSNNNFTKIEILPEKTIIWYGDNKKEVPTDKILDVKLPEVGLLSPAVRWVSPDLRKWVLERPPAMLSMRLYDKAGQRSNFSGSGNKSAAHFTIPVPWQIYYVALGTNYEYTDRNTSMFVRTRPLAPGDDELFLYPLANVDTDGNVCMHLAEFWYDLPEDTTLSERVSFCVNGLWESEFNHSIPNALDAERMPRGCPFKTTGSWSSFYKNLETVALADVLRWEYPSASFRRNSPSEKPVTLTEWIQKHTVAGTRPELAYQGTFNYMANHLWRRGTID